MKTLLRLNAVTPSTVLALNLKYCLPLLYRRQAEPDVHLRSDGVRHDGRACGRSSCVVFCISDLLLDRETPEATLQYFQRLLGGRFI
jgi:hypothetical protein